MKYNLCDDPWDRAERDAVRRVLESERYTMGNFVEEFERQFADKLGARHAVMVNSGSSANLLAVAALVYSGCLPRGSEVVVPAVSWSTTYAPLEQFGMKLVFVDIDPQTFNLSPNAFQDAISPDTKMVFLVNLLGNPNEFDKILPLCESYDILCIEDNCESLGGEYAGNPLGTFGKMGTFSFFYSHHLCTMEGGMVVTDDDLLYEYLLSVRAHGWTRNLPKNSRLHMPDPDPFYESYRFIVPGFNLRPLEMEGAIGLEQLKKLDQVIAQRRENASYFQEQLKAFPYVRTQHEIGKSSWFGFPLILQGDWAGKREQVLEYLREAEIDVRPIVAGNFARNPVIRYMDYTIPAPLTNADEIHFNGFFVGNHSKKNADEIDLLMQTLADVTEKL